MQVARLCLRNDARDVTFCENSALIQYNEIVARHDLVEQVRGPKHADALLDNQSSYMAENLGPRLDIEPDRRLVEQQKTRPVQKCPRYFQSPHLPA